MASSTSCSTSSVIAEPFAHPAKDAQCGCRALRFLVFSSPPRDSDRQLSDYPESHVGARELGSNGGLRSTARVLPEDRRMQLPFYFDYA
jgi:hypothetical protein